jgi:hypothetical protein
MACRAPRWVPAGRGSAKGGLAGDRATRLAAAAIAGVVAGAVVVPAGDVRAEPSGDASAAPTTPPPTAPAAQPTSPDAPSDELPNAGYIPGYRSDRTLGMSPYVPRVGALPGAMTPGYAAPKPSDEWTFRWSGFFTASLQASENQRVNPAPGQSKTVLHVPPQTIDEYASFVGTTTMPGEWAQMAFVYGNRYVSANVSLTTWNMDDPSTYYQIGSQQFINNAYLSFNIPAISGVRSRANVGYFYNAYGALGQYGPGMYTNLLVGGVRGVGEDVVAEYDLNDTTTVAVEDGVMGTRNGMAPINVIQTGQNGAGSTIWPAAWVHHVHLGIEKRGELTARARLHYLDNWAQDDRVQLPVDNPATRQINEADVKDGRIHTYGVDATLSSSLWGYLGAAASYTEAQNAYPVKGLNTFGGDGESLTNRWFGVPTGGNGQLVAAGVNYTASIGRIVSYPVPFAADGPDLTLNTGFEIARTSTDFQPFSGRVRHKVGVDLLYTFLPFMGVGLRGDRVVPNSNDSEETFHVIATRLVLKSNWNSRETITLIYGKWFYGPHTHPEASSIVSGDRLDDQLFALNAQIWW